MLLYLTPTKLSLEIILSACKYRLQLVLTLTLVIALAARLERLVETGILERRRYEEHPPRFEYKLTPAGVDLSPALVALIRWGDHHLGGGETDIVLVHGPCGTEPAPSSMSCLAPITTRPTTTTSISTWALIAHADEQVLAQLKAYEGVSPMSAALAASSSASPSSRACSGVIATGSCRRTPLSYSSGVVAISITIIASRPSSVPTENEVSAPIRSMSGFIVLPLRC